MAITEGQIQIGSLVMGRGTDYHVLKTDIFSWPSNRANRRAAQTQSGWDFDAYDLFTGRVLDFDILINSANLLSAMRALSLAALTTEENGFINLDVWLPHDTKARRAIGRTRNIAFPSFDRKIYSRSTECVFTFETELACLVSTNEKTASVGLPTTAGGHVYPATYPRLYGDTGEGGFINPANDGDFPFEPTFRINGPVTNPRITHQDLDRKLEFNITIADGSYLEVNVRDAEVLLNGTASRYGTLTNDSEWFPIMPGTNSLYYGASAFEAGSSLVVTWRDGFLV